MILRGSDNKILRSASGEILTQSDALIDLRSTFGVTKDGSNNVSKVKLYNNPSRVFRAPSGNEPIENGNGFEFDGVNDYLQCGTFVFDFNKLFIGLWVNVPDFTASQTIFNNISNTTLIEGDMRILFDGNGFKITLSPYGGIAGNIIVQFTPFDKTLWENRWVHLAITIENIGGTSYKTTIYADGFYKTQSIDDFGILMESKKNPYEIGVRLSNNDRYLNGNLEDFIINSVITWDTSNYIRNEIAFTPPKRSSE